MITSDSLRVPTSVLKTTAGCVQYIWATRSITNSTILNHTTLLWCALNIPGQVIPFSLTPGHQTTCSGTFNGIIMFNRLNDEAKCLEIATECSPVIEERSSYRHSWQRKGVCPEKSSLYMTYCMSLTNTWILYHFKICNEDYSIQIRRDRCVGVFKHLEYHLSDRGYYWPWFTVYKSQNFLDSAKTRFLRDKPLRSPICNVYCKHKQIRISTGTTSKCKSTIKHFSSV